MARLLLLGCAIGVLALGVPAQAQITLIQDGHAHVRVVTPDSPSFLERKAADELAHYLGRIGNAAVAVVREGEAPGGVRILVGNTRAGREIVPDADKQGPEGFVIRTRGQDVAVVGGGEYGALYGAYELLEQLGVRWYLPDPLGEIVPQRRVVTVPEINDAQKPAFAMRWVGNDDEWNLRNKQNRVKDPDYHPAFRVAPAIYHGQYTLLPPKQYFKDHPEYFALVDGTRSDDRNAKPCYSNPEVAEVIARNLADLKRRDPSISLLSFSPTDNQLWCECPGCRAMDDAGPRPQDQTYSRRSLLFYNRVAEDLQKDFPDQKLLVGAYNVYTRPPKDPKIKAHRNLAVIITHYNDYCNVHPINDPNCPPNREFARLIRDWQRLVPDVYIYEYYAKGGWVDLPWPLVHSITADIRYLRDQGVRGFFTQYSIGGVWTGLLDYYVAAKLLWNPDADVPAMLDEFYRNFFGAAAKPMKAYYQALEAAATQSGRHISGSAFHNARYVFTEDLIAQLGRCLDQARRLADDEAVRARIEKVAVSYDYTRRLTAYLRLADPERLQTLHEQGRLAAEASRLRAMAQSLLADLKNRRDYYQGVVAGTLGTRSYRSGLTDLVDEFAVPARDRAAELGLVGEWMLIGPFDNANMEGHQRAYPPEKEINLAATYQGKVPAVRWRHHRNPSWDGYIDLARLMKPNEWTCAYALCYVTAAEATRAQLRTGSNDSLVVWLGGGKVLDKNLERGAVMDDDITDVTLPAGTTPILLKVCQTEHDWGFYFRITDPQGRPLRGVRFSSRPSMASS